MDRAYAPRPYEPYGYNNRSATPNDPFASPSVPSPAPGGNLGLYGAAGGYAAGAGYAAHRNGNGTGAHTPDNDYELTDSAPSQRLQQGSHSSFGSTAPVAQAASPLAGPTYRDNPYDAHSISRPIPPSLAYVDPNLIIDDGDDGLGVPTSKRNSKVSLARGSNRSNPAVNVPLAGAAAAGVGTSPLHSAYTPVNRAFGGEGGPEKSTPWLKEQDRDKRRWKKYLLIGLLVLILLGIAGGIAGAFLGTRKSSSGAKTGSGSAQADDGKGDLDANSKEIKALMSNSNLHKVFSGMAYTPFNTQYPNCLTAPPSQNNVTRDMAVLSQITNVVRLYGTDCNQTEMVLHAIDRLELKDMKVWLGVWLGNNATTNARQLAQMWTILGSYGTTHLKGVVVGNEVLFRKDLSESQLATVLRGVKANLTSNGYNLPLATSDLGDNWTAPLAEEVDVIMSNVHPFFGGVAVEQAAAWSYTFWQEHDVKVTAGMTGKSHIISEFGWPSAGGSDCGMSNCTSKTEGAIAGIDGMNRLMNDWVCQALSNGTDYFWFEAFDEPWKTQYNTPGKEWEDKWGLFDIDRNLKKGVQIPNCGGKTVS
ncbi:glycoside hydrolase [Trichodelitschia bisporula]|uniref:glucan endo-1,3-beta-D-glucosidase n=1 Tax=Trichodelitschia bisporula TaxID=703511 RepID=A0A6G1HQH8_9PEZI|nr:glycoside hydrolase [Trichodelitschia bisporula]